MSRGVDWLSPATWYQKPSTEDGVFYKKQAFYALFSISSHSDSSAKQLPDLLKDIDMAAYICSHYLYQREDFLTLPTFTDNLKDIKKSQFILKHGCLEDVFNYIIELHPQLTDNRELAQFVFLQGSSFPKGNFNQFLKDKTFVKEILDKGSYNISDILRENPKDYQYTREAFKRRIFPTKETMEFYNTDIYNDKPFILECLRDNYGYYLYSVLPDNLQNDLEICTEVLKHHSHVKVKVNFVSTPEEFFSLQNDPYALGYESIITNSKNYPQIFNNTESRVMLLNYLSEKGIETYINLMGDPQFKGHALQKLLTQFSKEDAFFETFLATEQGQSIMKAPIKNYTQFQNFETKIMPQVGKWVNSYYLEHKLQSLPMNPKNNKKKKNMKMPKLHTELVPKTCFFTNVRSQVSKADWDWLRKETYKQAGYRCECCNRNGKMEAHEIWHYNDELSIQKLHGLICLCPMCHLTMHLGFAEVKGKLPQVLKHLATINEWTTEETTLYVEAVFEVWYQRSQKQWTLDLTFLDQCQVKYKKINPKQRAKLSEIILNDLNKK